MTKEKHIYTTFLLSVSSGSILDPEPVLARLALPGAEESPSGEHSISSGISYTIGTSKT